SRTSMKTAIAIDFPQLSELLQNFGALHGPAELHGFLVGQLATGKRFTRAEWLRTANEQADLSQSPDEVTGDRLFDLYRTALAELKSGELAFQLLLPDDDDDLLNRVESLGLWCQGFLTGFGLSTRLSRSSSSDRKSTRLNSSHVKISYAVFCLIKKKHDYNYI